MCSLSVTEVCGFSFLLRQVVAKLMSEATKNSVCFDPSQLVLTSGAASAIEILSFCLADSGNAFLVPTPCSPG